MKKLNHREIVELIDLIQALITVAIICIVVTNFVQRFVLVRM